MNDGLPKQPRTLIGTTLILLLFLISIFTKGQETLVGMTSNGGPQGKGSVFAVKTNNTGFVLLKEFADWGKNPKGNLILGADGFYYGMTQFGGINGYGSIFRVSPTGAITMLRHFNFATDGASPFGSLTLGPDGNFYGLTQQGGTNSYGTIFKMTPAGVFTVLKHLNNFTDGANPQGSLVVGKDGLLYGITRRGGSSTYGTIFKITTAGAFTVIKTLNGTTDGGYSYAGIAIASDGNFYGITYQGGAFTNGTIFKITPAGVYTVLRSLKTATDGSPSGSTAAGNNLVQHPDGFLYGLLYGGGTKSGGTIIKISTVGAFTVLRHLISKPDGAFPHGSLIVGKDGLLYGTLSSGGAFNAGTLFKITTGGIFTRLKDLTLATDGGVPKGSLLLGKDGNFWGTVSDGTSNFFGAIFKISTTGVYTVLTRFNGGVTGNVPHESLIQLKDFSYYGTTYAGGVNDYGTIFKICGGVHTVLHSFARSPVSNRPKGNLLQATDGNFYGTTSSGGTTTDGVIFKLTPAGVFSVLHTFNGATQGRNPEGSLIQGADGFLYGTTPTGGTGAGGGGTIFKISTAGVFRVIKHLATSVDGGNPQGTLVKGVDTFFYGTLRSNKIFKISPNGVYKILKTLVSAEGTSPSGDLILGRDGNFYGTCFDGGSANRGTIFQMTPAGVLKVMKIFAGPPSTDGFNPKGSLVQATDGFLYGMTSAGGTNAVGTLFKISTIAPFAFSVVRQFNLVLDGGTPFGSLIKQNVTPLIANPQTLTTNEDVVKAITLTGSGGTPLIYNITILPKHGVITGTGANRTYTPNPNANGKDSFYFTANIACQASAPGKVVLTVAPVNDAPVLDSIGKKTVKVKTLLNFTATAMDPDPGQAKTYSLIAPVPAGATIVANTGVFNWTPQTAGNYTLKVRVTDNGVPVMFDEEVVSVAVTAAIALPSTLDPEVLNEDNSSDISIYPNPVKNKFLVTLGASPQKVSVVITDIRGAVVTEWTMGTMNSGKLEFDIGRLSRGQYILKLSSLSKTWVYKLSKL